MGGLNLDELTNSELMDLLYKEFIFYDENLYELTKTIAKELPRKYVYRILNKLYRKRVR